MGPLNRRGVRDRIGGRNWSDFAGEGHKAPITAAPSLDDWHTAGGVPGIYAVASKGLARGYTDEQLVASGPFDLSSACEPGARSDFHARLQEAEDPPTDHGCPPPAPPRSA